MTLPPAFLDRPFAHRGLHDRQRGLVENSLASFDAAIARRYGIELDVQISRDGVPVVFHDATLDRLTRECGPVSDRTASELSRIRLGESDDTIPSLRACLDRIAGRVPVLVEVKDRTGQGDADPIDQVTGHCLRQAVGRHGANLAVMSFNPAYIAALDWLGDTVPRGLTSAAEDGYADDLPPAARHSLAELEAYDSSGASFISHDHRDLARPRIARLKAGGASILCWTVRSPAEEVRARRIADNITFEGYLPA